MSVGDNVPELPMWWVAACDRAGCASREPLLRVGDVDAIAREVRMATGCNVPEAGERFALVVAFARGWRWDLSTGAGRLLCEGCANG